MYSSLPPDSRLLQFHRPDRQPRSWAEEPAGRRAIVAAALAIGGLLVLALGRPNVVLLAGWLVGVVVLASAASGARTTRARAAAFALLSLAPALAAGTAVAAPHAADGPAAGSGGGLGASCDRDSCVLPLADFGSAGFAAAAATLDGRAAPIDRGDWTLEAVDMVGDAGAVKATVGPLAGDGTSFAVRFVSSALR